MKNSNIYSMFLILVEIPMQDKYCLLVQIYNILFDGIVYYIIDIYVHPYVLLYLMHIYTHFLLQKFHGSLDIYALAEQSWLKREPSCGYAPSAAFAPSKATTMSPLYIRRGILYTIYIYDINHGCRMLVATWPSSSVTREHMFMQGNYIYIYRITN